ncbi:uncharacterized protein TM35_000631170 [Trypanosoma theileri]|uniref:Uncharacterized protein n=1 Tax=Trypanosoma theileri TaxID=67003 RepID=A0A1X0NG26_9TRYP|nr:uncharacterized protein TM35_000631170 [Trypanosoma theileri]ORC83617.1 hypothetical protein TM35_000631170 [Trypanosoma theileri]
MRRQDGVNAKQHRNSNSRKGSVLGCRSNQNPHNRTERNRTHVRQPTIVQDDTVPAAFISPFQASLPQRGLHSASVVRASVSGPQQEQMLFYSSVQRRGGSFTKTAQETKIQLAKTGVLPNSTAFRKRARAAMEGENGKPKTLQDRFADMQSAKAEEEVQQAKTLVTNKSGSNRFSCDDDDDDSDNV